MEKKDETIRRLMRRKGWADGIEPNSWGHVEGLRDELTTDTERHSWGQAFEMIWEAVSSAQYDSELHCPRKDQSFPTPVEALIACGEFPRYPPPELLMCVIECFEIYFRAQGKLSLEDVFFGPAKKGVGNYSARKAANDEYRRFSLFCALQTFEDTTKGNSRKSKQELVELFLLNNKQLFDYGDDKKNFDMVDEVESFLKRLQRRRTRKKND